MVRRLFRIRHQVDSYFSLGADESAVARLVEANAFKGQSMLSWWTPFKVWLRENSADDHLQVLGDFPRFTSGSLAMTTRARDALEDFLWQRGEFLELETYLPLVLWNCTNVIDALDQSRTRGIRFPNGVGFISVAKYVMRGNRIDDEHIFKVPERIGSDLFISDAMGDAILEHGLTGLLLEPVEVS